MHPMKFCAHFHGLAMDLAEKRTSERDKPFKTTSNNILVDHCVIILLMAQFL